MTTVLDRIEIEEISRQARDVHAGRLLLTWVAAFFFVIGWLVGKAFQAVVWCAVAVKIGWQDARGHGSPRTG